MKYLIFLFLIFITACNENNQFPTLGKTPFNKESWLTDIAQRKLMINNFLQDNDVTTHTRSSLEKLLGSSDGYYLYDEFPAYRLDSSGDCLVTFPIDHETGKIKKAIVTPDNCAD